jgi:non-specific serine/threonine protein kinase
VHPIDRADHEQIVTSIQGAIGNAAFAEEFAAGKHMTLEQTIDYALAPACGAPGGGMRMPALDAEVVRLTAREREVAVLIAHGLTNRQIAEKLVVALRTATNHVEHILDKLGFHSRTQVAAWVTEHRLAFANETLLSPNQAR